jgi:uncharacterized protein (DUF952 family)
MQEQPAGPTTHGLIYRLADRAAWEEAERAGVYRGAEVDAKDGYLHFSSAARQDLVLLAVDTERLGAELRWEASRGGDLFPHLYAELKVGDVAWAKSVTLDADGVPLVADLL